MTIWSLIVKVRAVRVKPQARRTAANAPRLAAMRPHPTFTQRSAGVVSGVALLLVLLLLLLGACAGIGGPHVITLSEADLQRQLERNFPLDRRVLDAFDVSLTAPRVRLLSTQNRLAVSVDIGTRERVLGGRWQGVLAFDTALRWEPSDQSVRLTQVRVQDFTLHNSQTAARNAAERLGGALVERVLEEMQLYRLTPERTADLRRRGVAPGAVTVTARGVEITLTALPR